MFTEPLCLIVYFIHINLISYVQISFSKLYKSNHSSSYCTCYSFIKKLYHVPFFLKCLVPRQNKRIYSIFSSTSILSHLFFIPPFAGYSQRNPLSLKFGYQLIALDWNATYEELCRRYIRSSFLFQLHNFSNTFTDFVFIEIFG